MADVREKLAKSLTAKTPALIPFLPYLLSETTPIAVPDVVGMTEADTSDAITAVGLTVGEVYGEYDETVPSGQVISQNPDAGAEVVPGSAVDLVVSIGFAPVQEAEIFDQGLPIVLNNSPDEFAGGDGSLNDPWIIQTADQLNNVRNHLNAHFILDNDIDLSGYGATYYGGQGWEPVGTFGSPFTGSLDGNGKTISGPFINRPAMDYSASSG